MKRLIFLLFLFAIPAWSQTTINGRVQTGTNALKPATCAPGDQYNAVDLFQILVCGPANTWTPLVSGAVGGSPTQLQYNNGSFTGVTGSAVGTSGQITLTPSTDGFSALVVNPSSQNFGTASPALQVNAGTGTITCETLGGFAPAQMCINGATNQPWLYSLSILGDGAATASPTVALWDTARSTPFQAGALWNVGQCSSNFSANLGCLNWGYISAVDGTTSVINVNEDHSMQFGFGGAGSAQPFMTWGPQGDIPTGYINASTGEIQVGWIPTAFAAFPENGFFSIVDTTGHAHKVSITMPGTLSANYNFVMPLTAGTPGQVLTSQGGGSTNQTFSTIGEYCGATSGATQNCAKTVQTPLVVYGEVTLNTATSQSITTLPFADALYSCTGSDLTTAAGIVSFTSYLAASVTIRESGGVNTDHLRYMCIGH